MAGLSTVIASYRENVSPVPQARRDFQPFTEPAFLAPLGGGSTTGLPKRLEKFSRWK